MCPNLIRTIHNAGCGCFCTESFRNYMKPGKEWFNVVYDCGSNDLVRIVQNDAENYFNHYGEIDVLFISHLDQDHVNAIKGLKKFMNNNTKVFLPFFEKDFILLSVQGYFASYHELIQYLDSERINIIYIQPENSGSELTGELINIENIENKSIYSSGTVFRFRGSRPCAYWEYIPFNIQKDISWRDIYTTCLNEGITEEKLKECLENRNINKETIGKLKKVYSKISKTYTGVTSTNMSSMLLISKECKEWHAIKNDVISGWHTDINSSDINLSYSIKEYFLHNASCLYTGDAGLKEERFFDIVLKYYSKHTPLGIGIMQIPHHGTVNYYPKNLHEQIKMEMGFVNITIKSNNPLFYAYIPFDFSVNHVPLFMVTDMPYTRIVNKPTLI